MKLRNYILAIVACLVLCSASACGRNENPSTETKQEAGIKDAIRLFKTGKLDADT